MFAFMSENELDFFLCASALQLLVPVLLPPHWLLPASWPSSYMFPGCGQCPSGPGLTSRAWLLLLGLGLPREHC